MTHLLEFVTEVKHGNYLFILVNIRILQPQNTYAQRKKHAEMISWNLILK